MNLHSHRDYLHTPLNQCFVHHWTRRYIQQVAHYLNAVVHAVMRALMHALMHASMCSLMRLN